MQCVLLPVSKLGVVALECHPDVWYDRTTRTYEPHREGWHNPTALNHPMYHHDDVQGVRNAGK